MSRFAVHADASVVARRILAKVDLELTMAAHVSRFAMAAVVVDELDAVESSGGGARIRKALVDVSFAARSNKSGWALTFKGADAIDASTAVVASAFEALVDVDLAKDAQGAVRAGARERVDQIVTNSTVLTRIGEAVVDVVLAIGALESWRAGARVGTDEVFASGAVLTRSRVAFVDFLLTIAASVTC